MDTEVNTRRSWGHLVYALISLACPFIALGVAWLYVDNAYRDFLPPPGAPIDDADKNAAAMMGAVVVFQLIFAVGIGSLIGLGFAVLSLWKRRRFVSFGTAAMLFNLFPILGIAYLFFFVRNH